MLRPPPRSTLTDTLCPCTTPFRSMDYFDQVEYRLCAMPSLRHSSAMLSSPRRPSSTMRILSSAEKCRRVCRRISFTTCSAGAFDGDFERSEERRVGKSVSVRVDLGGRRIIKKKKETMATTTTKVPLHNNKQI